MAIAKIKKLEIIGLQKDKEELLQLLQKLALVQLIKLQEKYEGVVSPEFLSGVDLLEMEDAISYLASFKEKEGTLGGIVKIKPVVYQQQIQDIITHFDYQKILHELSTLRNQLKVIHHHKERLIQEKQLLSPWRSLRLSLEGLHYQQHCAILLGILNCKDYQSLQEDVGNEKINIFTEIVHQDKVNVYLAIFYLREELERLETVLKKYNFNFVTLTRHKSTAEDRLFEIYREVLILDDQIEEVTRKIVRLSAEQMKLMVVYEYLDNARQTQEANKNLSQQKFTFALNGWFRQKDEKIIVKALQETFPALTLFISEPREEDLVPVALENKKFIQPFEFITTIYGMPKYNELDPTPFLAPFFFLYFGFCVSDVGYGLILALFSLWVLKKFRLGPQGVRFFRLFFFCSISTIIVGALTGSWFGNLIDLIAESKPSLFFIKRYKDAMVIIDPMREPKKLLGIALSFGIIQVWFGNIVAGMGNWKNRRYVDILFDQVPMLVFLFGLTGIGMVFLELLSSSYVSLFKYSILIGGLGLVATQGRSEKGVGGKIFYGIYNLYNTLSGYLSDILSYSRLWALGLVTGVMATTINLISIQFSQIAISFLPFANRILFLKIIITSCLLIVLFVCGHLVSFLMSLLGAFVHPVRLQFVEFFSKFFKAGGTSFKPFKVETKYVNFN